MFCLITRQLSSDWSIGRPRYLKTSIPYILSSPSYPVRLKFISVHKLTIAMTLRLIWISVFLNQWAVSWCLISCHNSIYILHFSQQGGRSFSSCNSTTFEWRCQYIKCSCIFLALWDNAGNPGTWQSIVLKTLKKYITYLVPPPHTSTPLVCGKLIPWDRSMWLFKEEAANEDPQPAQLTWVFFSSQNFTPSLIARCLFTS